MKNHRSRTLVLATVLHAFTHIYQMALTPLFLLIQNFYGRDKIEDATLLLTLLLVAYFLPSYPMGILADRFSRKRLLSIGLVINGLGFIGLALAPTYSLAIASVVVAGLGGSFFHPSATALVARLYPGKAGRALGLLGIGASIGFFIGPFYAGWRAKIAHDWRVPVLELGIAGLVGAALFAWLADEHGAEPSKEPHALKPKEPMFPTPTLWLMFLLAALFFFFRDFAGSSMSTVGSLFLQKARGFDVERTGFTISFIFLASAISNPLFGHLSDGSRMKWAAVLMVISAVLVAIFPRVPNEWILPALLAYGFFFMASYPIVEAALMESVPDAVRGRVFGLFITIGGLLGNLSHWIDGRWVESFGPRIHDEQPYRSLYGWLAIFLLISLAGLPCLRAIRRREMALAKTPH
ncbi:MAG TPA: MFS transporter [Candidatus Acidoferrum sp.]|nr:MFS transporter [Candidatus Acidoferrum sp.]